MISLARVNKLLDEGKIYYAAAWLSMQQAENAYNLRLPSGIKLPADTPVHYPSTAPAIVDHFVDQVRTSNPAVTIGPLGKGSRSEERRSLLEAFGRLTLERTTLTEDDPIWDYVTFGLGLLGASCLRVLFDESKWSDKAEEQAYLWPFTVRALHPKNVIVSPGHRFPYAYVIERQRRYVSELKADYPDWKPLTKGGLEDNRLGPTDHTEVLIYWDSETYAMFAGNNKVFDKPNLLGCPPYIWGYSGLGHKSEDSDPDAQAAGIIKHIISELQSEIRLKTAADSSWVRYVWPALFGTISQEEMQVKWSAGAGRYIQIKDMEEMPQFLPPPELNQSMFAMVPQLRASMERATYSEVLAGQPGTADYGVLYGMQLGQARLRVDAVRHAVERIVGRYIGLCARYFEKVVGFDGSVLDVFGKKLDAGDIGGHYDFRVKFEPLDPLDNDRRIQTGNALRQSGNISRRTFLRDFARVKDVAEEEEQILVEQAIETAIKSGQLTPVIAAAVANEEARQGVEEQQKVAESERGAPFGDRLAGLTPGGEGPSPTARAGV